MDFYFFLSSSGSVQESQGLGYPIFLLRQHYIQRTVQEVPPKCAEDMALKLWPITD